MRKPFAAFAGTVRRIVRFFICVFRGLPYYGYDAGCDYCVMCPRAISTGHCDRGERMGYNKCGTNDLESNAAVSGGGTPYIARACSAGGLA